MTMHDSRYLSPRRNLQNVKQKSQMQRIPLTESFKHPTLNNIFRRVSINGKTVGKRKKMAKHSIQYRDFHRPPHSPTGMDGVQWGGNANWRGADTMHDGVGEDMFFNLDSDYPGVHFMFSLGLFTLHISYRMHGIFHCFANDVCIITGFKTCGPEHKPLDGDDGASSS